MFLEVLKYFDWFRKKYIYIRYSLYSKESINILFLICILILAGAVGFKYFESSYYTNLTWGDSIWWSIVTMTTVGYGDFFPKTFYGRYFVALPIMSIGIGVLGYILSLIASILIESRSEELKGMSNKILKEHIVVINFQNYDRNLKIIKEFRDDLKTKDLKIVLVDEYLEELPLEYRKFNVHFVKGNPSKESVLKRAYIQNAHYAIVLSDSSETNTDNNTLATALMIKSIEPKVFTVVECLDFERVELMKRSGCDGIVCTDGLTASFLVQEVSDPGTHMLINELMSNNFGQQVYIVPIKKMKDWIFSEAQTFLYNKGYIVMGIKQGKETRLNPDLNYMIQKNDHIICIGSKRPEPIFIG